MSARDVIVVNTLGGALHHYAHGLAATLSASGARVSVTDVHEPSVAGGSGVDWVRRYLLALWAARRDGRRGGARVIVTWPVLGHLDRVIMRVVLGRRAEAALVVHDPHPLVRARGYGVVARRIGSLARGVRLIVHSRTAATALRDDCPGTEPELLPHPVAPRPVPVTVSTPGDRPVVRVLGQFKPDRDLALLAGIGQEIGHSHRLEIVGRRWPEVDGWSVTDAFVDEDRLDELLATADAVVVPYKRFFQSGIAIRSLEVGTPAVGPAGSSIADLYPDDRYLGDGSVSSWCDAISSASAAERDETRAVASRADRVCRAAWAEWLMR
ncbi:hypothetical protein [Curtobacterium sp. SORGH_AS_0776]|uniref:hypothetical protein n=1 Tax=Curtobacterium sp. SORGH_AS_0776 TaxID=3041798 RepID=UPI0028675E27|nr:hypothetical protein [Curtobacterium sp. SORGH_AS_0776]MDR6169990.1 hypothetical protein [Curtobacterium sp. SORGH_AS_0776]